MQLTLQETRPYVFTAENASGCTIPIAANPDLAGKVVAMRPVELLPSSLAACSAIDLRLILTKQRQQVDALAVEVLANRDEEAVPSLLTSIRLQYMLTGDIDTAKATRALSLALEKYCTVYRHLSPTIAISYSLIINGKVAVCANNQ